MKKQLWQGLLVAGIAAFTVPSFVQGQAAAPGSAGSTGSSSGMTSGSSGSSGTHSGTGSGTLGMPGSSSTRSSTPNMPGTSNTTGTTGMTSSPAGSMAADMGSSESDKRLNTQIRQALNTDASLAGVGQNVQLSTQNGKVTLRGSVSSEAEKKQIEQKVKQMSEVDNVDNQLQVASSGSSSSMHSPSSNSPSTSSDAR